MSSDCYTVRIKSVDGDTVVLDVLTGTAGGVDDMAVSRSFALCLLHEALDRATESVAAGAGRAKEVKRLRDKRSKSALYAALESEGEWSDSEPWMRANVGRFVKSCLLVERRNNVGEASLRRREAQIVEQFGALYTDKAHLWRPLRWERCHSFTLRVTVTEPRWAEHLEPGLEFGTASYDVLWEGIAWAKKPPSKDRAKKSVTKKSVTKKSVAKKSAKKAAKKQASSKSVGRAKSKS